MSDRDPLEEERRTAYKRMAAEEAVKFVQSGMVVGLGTGSTAIFAIRRLAQLLRNGGLTAITGFATSEVVREEAGRLDIPVMDDEMPFAIDLTIDGADEVDSDLNLIKGGGGAMLREKIAAQASRRIIIVADDSKISTRLGIRHTVPVEILPFGWCSQFRYLESLAMQVKVRHKANGSPFMTDSANMILDCDFGPIADPVNLAARLAGRAGIVEHGLFLGLATDLIVGGGEGIRHLTRSSAGHPRES